MDSSPSEHFGSSTSSTLLRRAAKNEPAAWEMLVNLCHPMVFDWVQRSNWQRADVENVVQDVFTTVALRLPEFELRETGSFRGWLRRIVRSKVIDYARRKSRETKTNIEADWESFSIGDECCDAKVMYTRVLQIIRNETNERDWHIFWRKEVERASAQEVANEMNLTVAAVYAIIARLRRHVRQVFGEFLE